jgi:hypothetical protein
MDNVQHIEDRRRAEVIAGLRALADFIEQHPDFPLPTYPEFMHCSGAQFDAEGAAEVRQIAEILDAPLTMNGGSANTERMFGALRYRAFYVSRHRMDEHHQELRWLEQRRAVEVLSA